MLSYLIHFCLLTALFYSLYALLIANTNKHQLKRTFLLLSLIASLTFPFIQINISAGPDLSIPIIKKVTEQTLFLPEIAIHKPSDTTSIPSHINTTEAMLLIYCLVTLLLSIRFARSITKISLLLLKNRDKSSIHEDYVLVPTNGQYPTCSFFKYIFWNNSTTSTPNESKQILLHEKAHILQKHSLDIIGMELLQILFWFNPFIHLFKKAFIETHEYLADQYVINHHNTKDYSQLLAKQCLIGTTLHMGIPFSQSQTIKRIKMIQTKNTKTPLIRLLTLVISFPLAFYFTSCEHTEEASQKAGYDELSSSGFQVISESDLQGIDADIFNDYVALKKENPENEFVAISFNQKNVEQIKNTANWKPIQIERSEETYLAIMKHDKSWTQDIFNNKSFASLNLPEINASGELIYTRADTFPTPEGGLQAFYSALSASLKYPQEAIDANIEGKVFVQFVVDKTGAIISPTVIKGIGYGCDAAAVEALKNIETWIPGQKGGKNIAVRMVLPINFKQ